MGPKGPDLLSCGSLPGRLLMIDRACWASSKGPDMHPVMTHAAPVYLLQRYVQQVQECLAAVPETPATVERMGQLLQVRARVLHPAHIECPLQLLPAGNGSGQHRGSPWGLA